LHTSPVSVIAVWHRYWTGLSTEHRLHFPTPPSESAETEETEDEEVEEVEVEEFEHCGSELSDCPEEDDEDEDEDDEDEDEDAARNSANFFPDSTKAAEGVWDEEDDEHVKLPSEPVETAETEDEEIEEIEEVEHCGSRLGGPEEDEEEDKAAEFAAAKASVNLKEDWETPASCFDNCSFGR
jgi:hypothetical protein